MVLSDIFVSHLNNQNQIETQEATFALGGIFLIIIVLITFTTKWSKPADSNIGANFRQDTSEVLRGVAILCLLLGHFSMKCVQGTYFFELAGRWAVIIFLFISGVGLTKRYTLSKLPSNFLYKRITKLLPSLWISMLLFIALDFVILDKTYSYMTITLNIMGIITPLSANGPAWYVTYIMVLYSLYYMTSKIHSNPHAKILILYFVCYLVSVMIWIFPPLSEHIIVWAEYTIVFPSAVLIGIYFKDIHSELTLLLRRQRVLYISFTILISYMFIRSYGAYIITDMVNSIIFQKTILMLYDGAFICALTFFTVFFDYYQVRSKFLSAIGKYSLEIFLIHLPFMESYDFFLFRKPLTLMVLLYFAFILVLSIALRKITAKITNLTFDRQEARFQAL